jgi:hypothetical protein
MVTTKFRTLAPKRRSAISSKATSPAPRKQAHTGRTSESPLSRRPSEHDDSDDSANERSSAGYLSDRDATRGEQRATPNASKQAGGKKKRTASTRYHSNTELPSWKSDQPTGVVRAPAKPTVQPQRAAAPSAEPAQKIIHGETEWMQGRSLQGLISSNTARLELILLPSKFGCSAHAYDRGPPPGPAPDSPGDGGRPPSPPPIGQNRGRSPVPDSRRGFRALWACPAT